MSEPIRPPLGARLWRLGGVPRAVLARLEGARDRLEQLTFAADQALAASPLLGDPTAALVAPIALDRVLGDRLGSTASDEDAAGGPSRSPAIADAPASARAPQIEPASDPRRPVARAASRPGPPFRSAIPPASNARAVRAHAGSRTSAAPTSADVAADNRPPTEYPASDLSAADRRVEPAAAGAPAMTRAHAPSGATVGMAASRGSALPIDRVSATAARAWLIARAERAGATAILDQIVAGPAGGTAEAARAETPSDATPSPGVARAMPPAAVPSAAHDPMAVRTHAAAPAGLERPGPAARAAVVHLTDLVDRLAPGSSGRRDRPSAPRSVASRPSAVLPARPGGAPELRPMAPLDRDVHRLDPGTAVPGGEPPWASSARDRADAGSQLPSALPTSTPLASAPLASAPLASAPLASAPLASAPLSSLRRFALMAEAPAPPSPGAPPLPRPAASLDDAELADRIDRILRREARREGLELDP